jgi:hypothetical protein
MVMDRLILGCELAGLVLGVISAVVSNIHDWVDLLVFLVLIVYSKSNVRKSDLPDQMKKEVKIVSIAITAGGGSTDDPR